MSIIHYQPRVYLPVQCQLTHLSANQSITLFFYDRVVLFVRIFLLVRNQGWIWVCDQCVKWSWFGLDLEV